MSNLAWTTPAALWLLLAMPLVWVAHHAARMFETGVAPWPVERTVLTSAVLAGKGVAVSYKAPRESQFATA